MANLILACFIIQYFLINKGISVTSDIKKLFCHFNDFGLKCLLLSTDMQEIFVIFLNDTLADDDASPY